MGKTFVGSGYIGDSIMDVMFGGSLASSVPATTWPFSTLTINDEKILFSVFESKISARKRSITNIRVTGLGSVRLEVKDGQSFTFQPTSILGLVRSLEGCSYVVDTRKLRTARVVRAFASLAVLVVMGLLAYGWLAYF